MLYYYPNRPILVPPDPKNPLNPKPTYINTLEKSGKYIGEDKWNGDNILIYTDNLEIWNRHKKKHRYTLLPDVRKLLLTYPKRSILNAELVHFKTKTVKDLIIVHSLLAWDGQLMSGQTWGYARSILETQGKFNTGLRLSETFQSGFWKHFQAADGSVIEGIILKDPTGKIIVSAAPIPDVSWMLKIRKPCKKYSF